MTTVRNCLSKSIISMFLLGTVICNNSNAQKPLVNSIDKKNAGVNETVTINGDNFGGDASRLSVFFGAVKGSISSTSNQIVEVNVPAGSTYNNISVTNLNSGLTGYTKEQFLLSFGGTHPFQSSQLGPQIDFNGEKGLYDLCMCDFDGDNKPDVATANDDATAVKILPNNSSGPGNISFNTALTSIPLGTKSLHTKCGDLNGDGKPDLVVSESGGDRIFIFTNTSSGTGNFNFTSQSIKLTGRKTKRISIADLDLDGRPELIISDQGSNILTILVNQSTVASINFSSTPINFVVTGAPSTDGLAVQDIDGDKLPEILTTPFLTATSSVYIVKNQSTPGTVSLGTITTQILPGNVAAVNIRVGDLDGDNKPDIVVSQLLVSSVAILLNTSSGSSISFASPKSFATEDKPWGIDFGDLDGDGKTDVVVSSIVKGLTILNNESTPGNLSFQTLKVGTTFINRHLNVGDVDGDGKPDIVFTSVDDNNTGILASKVSVFRNKNCMVPEITPMGPLSVCSGTPLRLNATVSRGTTYQWKNETTNTVVATGTNAYYDVTATGKYSVTAIAEGGTCSQVSNIVDVTVGAGAGVISGPASASSNGPLCVGNTMQLSVNDVGGSQYKWTGPNGYTGTGLMPAPINNFGTAQVGRYTVEVYNGGCVVQTTSTVVEAIDIGNFTVTYSGSQFLCQGNTKTLTIVPDLVGASYQWYEQTAGLLGGQTSVSLTVNATGNYYATIGYPGCSNTQTNVVNIVVASNPVADFSMPASACSGQLVQFTNQSTTDPSATAEYLWTFGDGNTSTLENPQHSYSTSGNFNAKLRVTYQGGVCPNETPTKPINVQSAPVPVITSTSGLYDICPGESLTLQVTGSYNSYEWSNGATTPTIDITEGGTYSVEVTTSTCTLNASRDIDEFTASALLVTATPQDISEGQTSQLNVEGLSTFLWEPEATLSDPTIANPIASPKTTTLYTVSGNDLSGCTAEGSVTVSVKGDAIVTKLTPKKYFSPNDDETNQYWIVDKIVDYPQCGVTIYDDKGIKLYEAKPYFNDWNGITSKGKRLPDGVYYYIIRCDGEEDTPKTGSITLLR